MTTPAATAPASPLAGITAKPPEIPTSAFAARNPFDGAKISPDGSRIAMVMELDGKRNLSVMDVASKKFISHTGIDIAKTSLEWFRWAGNDRIIFSLSSFGAYGNKFARLTRLFVCDLVTNRISYVGRETEGRIGDDVLYVDPAGQFVELQVQASRYGLPAVRRFMLDGSKTYDGELVQSIKADVWGWMADNAGVVRVAFAIDESKLKVLYRKSADEDFTTIGILSLGKNKYDENKDRMFGALKIVSGSDEGLTLDKGPSGKVALRKIDYRTGETGDVVYENKDWDVTNFAVDDDGKPIAAFYTDDRDRIQWLEPNMAKQQKRLEAALNGNEVWITSRADGDSRMIVWQGGANDPGAYYLFTPAKNSLDELAELRPGIPLDDLAPVKPVTYTARDGTAIHAYLTLPVGREARGLPLIVLPHGGPYGVRDKLDYNDEVQLLANRGYAVLQPNFRGSEGYGKEFEKLGEGQIGRAMQDDLDDAMDWAVAQGFAAKDRVCVVGGSYGGFAALWAVIRNPERYRCAASFAGVTDFSRQLRYDSNFFSSKRNRAWRSRIRGEDKSFDLGDISPVKQAAKLTRPILLAHGKRDNTVPFNQFRAMQSALKEAKFMQADYLIFDEEGHGFDKPEDEQKWYDALEAFLKKNNPPD